MFVNVMRREDKFQDSIYANYLEAQTHLEEEIKQLTKENNQLLGIHDGSNDGSELGTEHMMEKLTVPMMKKRWNFC